VRVQAAMQQFGISEALAGDIYDIARQENIDPEVAYGLVRTESTFDERAVSHVGARGLTQVMPRTARGVIPGTTTDQLFERKTNLRLGFRYLDQLVQKYRGNVELALTAYNRGPGTVDKVLKRGGNPDNGYAGKVLRGS
jgi:soluble lytic murein transglycosylase-like protein